MQRGLPVRTITANPGDPQVRKRIQSHSREIMLGYRIDKRPPTHYDYEDYEQRLRDFFRDNHRARVAIMSGGILWRLVVEAIGFTAALDYVLEGPSQDRFQFVYETKDASGNGLGPITEWWDDTLTEEEEDLICGVYRVYSSTCKFSLLSSTSVLQYIFPAAKKSTSHSSWWPKAMSELCQM